MKRPSCLSAKMAWVCREHPRTCPHRLRIYESRTGLERHECMNLDVATVMRKRMVLEFGENMAEEVYGKSPETR